MADRPVLTEAHANDLLEAHFGYLTLGFNPMALTKLVFGIAVITNAGESVTFLIGAVLTLFGGTLGL